MASSISRPKGISLKKTECLSFCGDSNMEEGD